MFCHHHDEAEVYGSEPVPCPFCGLGGPQAQESEDESTTLAIEDSNEALRNVLFDRETTRTGDELTGYW